MEPAIMRFAREAYERHIARLDPSWEPLCLPFDALDDEIKSAWCAAIKPLADLQPVANEAMFALKDVNQGVTLHPIDTRNTAKRLCIALGLNWDEVNDR